MAQREDHHHSELAKQTRDAASADESELRQYVTPLVSLERQVGGHVVHALQQDNTVAVLTTVVPGPDGQQCIVSVGLDAERLGEVQQILEESQADPGRVPCVGFHCFLGPKKDEGRT